MTQFEPPWSNPAHDIGADLRRFHREGPAHYRALMRAQARESETLQRFAERRIVAGHKAYEETVRAELAHAIKVEIERQRPQGAPEVAEVATSAVVEFFSTKSAQDFTTTEGLTL
ncbi:hypothetical protein [Mycolicibacter heraklionensis]|nr:hypothetical protein [Mycolicibacter heraklionensis]